MHLEYGTEDIAGGKVKALGDSPEITDDQAVKNWPAVDGRGGTGQQMPWLRPAVNAIEDWIEDQIEDALDF